MQTTGNYVHDKLRDNDCNILFFVENKIKVYLPSNDYKELLEPIIIFLGGTSSNGIKFCQPDAYHLARWIAKAIYCLKMYMFRYQIEINYSEETVLGDICCFISICYAQNSFTSRNSIQIPLNNILFLRKLVNYKRINIKIVDVALMKFCNHLWYGI